MFKERKEYKNHLDERINEYDKSLEKIVHDLENRNVMIEGSCEDCKEWHEKLKRLEKVVSV